MNLCLNGFPTEEGAWTRRSGTRRTWAWTGGNPYRIWTFNYSVDSPYTVALAENYLVVFAGDTPVLDGTAGLVSINAGNPVIITVDAGQGTVQPGSWTSGNVIVLIPESGWENSFGSLPNQVFIITALGNNQFSLTDNVTGATVNGDQIIFTNGMPQATIGHVYTPATPYTGTEYYAVSAQVFGTDLLFFHPNYAPYTLSLTGPNSTATLSTFGFAPSVFDDGPYLDPAPGQTATVSGIGGTITVTLAGGFGPKQSFPTSADIGRTVRLFNEPLAWDSGTSYTANVSVSFGGLYYSSLVTTTAGLPPSTTPQQWWPNPDAAAWVWGTITAVISESQISVALAYDLLYATTINSWQLGAIGDPGNNPTCACGHENRLWMFAGTWMYGSQSGSTAGLATAADLLWSPTLINGTVVDANAISYQLQSAEEDGNNILWGISGIGGMVLGTAAGEWVVKASALDDPLSPTTIQARRVTRYKSYGAKPVNTPLATVFVQKFQRKVMEFLPDVFTGRYVAPNLTATAKHLTTGLVEELAYQEEVTPIVWLRTLNDGALRGITYRRTSAFTTEAPAFVGWHQHVHGQGRTWESIQSSPSPIAGNPDTFYGVTALAGTGYQTERMVKQFDVDDSIYSAWFLDNATTASAVIDQGTGVELWGFYDKAGKSVEVFIGGLDLGAYTVGAEGQIVVPYTSVFTPTYVQDLAAGDFDYGEAAATVTYSVNTTPTRSPTPSTVGNYAGSAEDHSNTFNSNTVLLSDFAHNQFYTISGTISGASSFELRSYDLTTRAAGPTVQLSTIDSNGVGEVFCFQLAPSGNLLLALDAYDNMELFQVDPSSMTLVSSFGSSNNTGTPTGLITSPGHINASAVTGGVAGNYLVTVCGTPTLTAALYTVNIDTMSYAYAPGSQVAWNSVLCRGQTGTTESVFVLDNDGSHTFTLRQVVFNAAAQGWTPALVEGMAPWSSIITYSIDQPASYDGGYWQSNVNSNLNNTPQGGSYWRPYPNPYIALVECGTIAPAQVDATWSTMSTATVDMGYDQTDGNLILVVQTTDSVTHTCYAIKVNAVNAAVMWALPLMLTNQIHGLALSRIIGGQVAIPTDAGNLYSIDTLAGLLTTTLAPAGLSVGSISSYAFDGVEGSLYALYDYNSATSGAPTPLSGTPSTFNEMGVYTPGTSIVQNTYTVTGYSIPAIAGFPFNSQGQILRSALPGPGESGAQTGPALGKKRRTSKYSMLLVNSGALTVGTDFTNQFPVPLLSAGGVPYTISTLFSGVVRDTLSDDFSFDGMLAWATGTSCYPVTIATIGAFIETNDE